MADLEETRKKIGVDSLDKETREKLFKDFVKSGGKVLSEKDIMRQKIREQLAKQKELKNIKKTSPTQSSSYQPKPTQQTSKPIPKTTPQKTYTTSKKYSDLGITFVDRLKVFLNAYFQGIIGLSGKIKRKFFEKTLKEIPTAFLDMRIVAYLLTSKDNKLTNLVKKSLNALNPIGYEIIYRLNEFPNNELFEKMDRMYKLYLQTKETTKPEVIKEILKYIFKKLYLMYPFRDQMKVLVSTGLRAISQYISKSDFQRTEKLFYKTCDFLFNEYFFQIKSVIDLVIGKELSLDSEHLIRFLDIKEEDYVGYLTEKMGISKVDEEKPKKEEEQKQSKATEEKKTPVEEGLKILNNIEIKKIQDNIKRKDLYLEYNDKIFITEALIEFYEKHIYPVLVLKTKYSIVFDVIKTLDVKKIFDDIYTNIRSLRDKINEYYKVVEDLRTIESDIMVPINRKSGLINTRSMERTKLSYQIRKDFIDVIGRIKNNLELILSDYKSGGNILLNPQDTIEFQVDKIKDIEVERNFFEGKKVIDAIEEIHKIISAFIFLFTDGDLGGSNVKLEKPVYLNL